MASQVARDTSIILERLAMQLNEAGAGQDLLGQFEQLARMVRETELRPEQAAHPVITLDSRQLEEVPFPRVETTQAPYGYGVRFVFGDQQDMALFRRWLVKDGGWAAFGTYVDERRG
jgi:hypothetical protein